VQHGEGDIEDGPQVRLTESRAVAQPVHFSLLADPHDKALLKYHATGQVALIDVRTPVEHEEMHIAGSRLMPLKNYSSPVMRAVLRRPASVS
jgi:hypothetical protein